MRLYRLSSFGEYPSPYVIEWRYGCAVEGERRIVYKRIEFATIVERDLYLTTLYIDGENENEV